MSPRNDPSIDNGGAAGTARGATSVRDDEGGSKKKAWWLLPLLLGLALLALLAFLVARNAGDEGDNQGVDTSNEGAAADDESDASGDAAGGSEQEGDAADGGASESESGATSESDGAGGSTTTTPTTSGGGQGGAAPAGSSLTADGQALLPLPAGGLGGFAGKEATGTSVTVESVVADEGFWVGSSPADRVFVHLITTGESPVRIEAGEVVSFTGTVTANPADAASQFGVDAEEGAAQLEQQGHHLEVSEITQG